MMEVPPPVAQHELLKRFLGTWSFEGKAIMGPDQTFSFSGTEAARQIGPYWVMCEGTSTGPDGQGATTMLVVGYEASQSAYVGVWFGSMMDKLWTYTGSVNESGTTLTLETEGICPGMEQLGNQRFREVHEFIDDNNRVYSSRMLGPDGSWNEMLRVEYRRAK